MEINTIQYTPTQNKHITSHIINLMHSRLKSIQINAQFVGILHKRDQNFSAIDQFSAILNPQTRFSKTYSEPQYILKQLDEEIILEGDQFQNIYEGTVIGINGNIINDKLSGEVIFSNQIIQVLELETQESISGTLLASDINSSVSRLAIIQEFAKQNNHIKNCIIGGNLYKDPLSNDNCIKLFEFSPTDTYIQMQTQFKFIDSLLSQFDNITIMSGHTDPTSLQMPIQPLPDLCFPISKVKRSGNPSICRYNNNIIIFINYGKQVDLQMIYKSGHLYPEAGLHLPMKEMSSDCLIQQYDILVAFGQNKSYIQKLLCSEKVVYLISIHKNETVILDFDNLDKGINIISI
ncbi:hypothetical protein SS50377_22142 [Spironucleus salmonicida]|uniref:DNA polymerase delta small subunit n=1 Tax=Spironucleus salmonicida TaxID=348837 RepID=V6LY39_9EUKA|nr:hypothetical protein SS50377_22142 [Spironucleus salmonicida]|eukprot:EST45699.1 Hypothetical protein SS50377_14270 [Spironucleus salmonicida]